MKILALEPYHGGSHKAFLDGWLAHSRHAWVVLDLPPYKWKWRMRHSAITLANEVCGRVVDGQRWDVLFCSDMLNLAEFLGLVPESVRQLPCVAYFHENQLTYPVRHETERDYHFALTNITTALAATRVWFNSAFHHDSFLGAIRPFLQRMPDYQPFDVVDRIASKACIQPQGVHAFPARGPRRPGPMRLLWAARWEHDKDPDTFFEALTRLEKRNTEFRISVVGEQFRECPPVFAWAKDHFQHRIDRWGFQATRNDYEEALLEADVVVSTAQHEFFGVSVVEAIAAGAYPLLPHRLAYPEILDVTQHRDVERFFYDGSAKRLADRLAELADRIERYDLWQGTPDCAIQIVKRFSWPYLAPVLDDAMED